MGRKRRSVGRALRRALGEGFVLPEVEPREPGTSLLMNPRRQRVFEYVWNHPCSHLRRISRDVQIPPQSLRWHLLRLREGGILASRAVKGKTVYFAPWALREQDVRLFASLSNGMKGRIVRWVAERRRTTQSEIFRGLKTYQQAVLPPLAELASLGILRTWKAEGKRFYELGDAYARLGTEYAAVSSERIARALAVLAEDGVSPKVASRGDHEVQVQVSNGVQKSILRLRLTPAMR